MARRRTYLPRGKLTPELKVKIIEYLAEMFAPALAAHSVGVCHETYRRHYHQDPAFKAAVDDARLRYAHKLRKAVHRRAVVGYTEKHFDAKTGALVRTVRKYSDSLMLRHIARFDPTYRESTKVEQKTTISGSIETKKTEVSALPPEVRAGLFAAAKAMAEQAKKASDVPSAPE